MILFEMVLSRIYDTFCCRRKKSGWFFTLHEYKKKKLSGRLSFIFRRLFLFGYTRLKLRHYRNKRMNRGIDGYINGQGLEVGDMRLGSSRIEDVGCECIAVCNAMHRINRHTPLCDVICEIEMNHMTWFDLGGCLGIDPRKLYRYFDAHNVKYKTFGDMAEFEKKAKNRTCILGYRIAGSRFRVHTVMLYQLNGSWIVYNRYSNSQKPMSFSSLNDVIGKGKFIVGHVIYRKQKQGPNALSPSNKEKTDIPEKITKL